jgi:hypothetical protein
LAAFVDELESGEGYELGGNDVSEGSEDGLGYESYYYDGTGRGQGDGGGDTSSGGGLKLTGEYRGWNILEAWADRSVRKWHESGVIVDTSLLPEDGKKPKVSTAQRSTLFPELKHALRCLRNQASVSSTLLGLATIILPQKLSCQL